MNRNEKLEDVSTGEVWNVFKVHTSMCRICNPRKRQENSQEGFQTQRDELPNKDGKVE